ncbi:DEKNAAC101247 [Brettanomyces naardenensis]|uniref:DEKNAAC101247 n=1 Tax=Brettanomyces naardenensis TaxID=13370 RepID=A0A448YHU6_BRENA|nr:DEKNAAC101247 [Brettanomyces naardenensis]
MTIRSAALLFITGTLAEADVAYNQEKSVVHTLETETALLQRLPSILFPLGPSGNSIISVLYISGLPTILMALMPSQIGKSRLSRLVSFAVGGLLGDIFLHLLPETFLSHSDVERSVSLDTAEPLVLGLGAFSGFLLFFIVDKCLRILQHEELQDENSEEVNEKGSSTSVSTSEGSIRFRKRQLQPSSHSHSHSQTHTHNHNHSHSHSHSHSHDDNQSNSSARTSAFLNLISDFTHNITDGLTLSSAFYLSQNAGSTATMALMLHEVPHQIGDFGLLLQGGFTKRQALKSHFITALGALLGVIIGIILQSEISLGYITPDNGSSASLAAGVLETTIAWKDLIVPFTSGSFVYIVFSVLPELLEVDETSTKKQAFYSFLSDLAFLSLGFTSMFYMEWNE